MGVTIKVIGLVADIPSPFDGQYVAGNYAPEHHGFGDLPVTADRTKARVFADAVEAQRFWAQEHPQGMGGQNMGGPNRPLTAFTIQIDRVES